MRWKALTALSILCISCGTAAAFINPSFTPVDLVQQSEVVLVLEFRSIDAEGEAVAEIQSVLKGEFSEKEFTVDLLAGAFEAQGRAVMGLIARGEKQALLFVGFFEEEGMGVQDPAEGAMGFLHLGGQWVVLSSWERNVWGMEKIDARLQGTWAGSTDMLLRAVKYIQSDPDADVPVSSGVEWAEEIQLGKLEGKVCAVEPVDLTGEGRLSLFVAGERGDHLFRFNGKTFEDVTAEHALASKSLASAWGDFDGDGRLDLASWDGKELSIHRQRADGSFEANACRAGDALKNGCLALTTLDYGNEGRPALLASTKASPVLLIPRADGSVQSQPLVGGDFPGKDLGGASRCFVADFDDDGIPDVLQLLARGGLFYKGKAPGAFSAPVRTQMATGEGRHGVCLGDYDADGLLDVFVAGERGSWLWHSLGGGRFVETLAVSGEIAYISKPGGLSAQTGDFNNDGRQDILIAYATDMCPQLFFNRGFRSFGHARMVDLTELARLPQAAEGQQASCLADLNGDGALDMALVLANGELWLFPREVGEDGALAVTAALSLASPCAGPVTVWAWRYERPFGAWTVRPGEPGAFIGLEEAGPVSIKWRFPGGQVREKEIIVEDGPVRVVLDKK